MPEFDRHPAPAPLQPHQPALLEKDEVPFGRYGLEERQPKGARNAEQVEGSSLGRAEPGKPGLDEFDESGRRHRRIPQLPQPVGLNEGAGLEPRDDELPEEQGVPLATIGESAPGHGIDRTSEDGLQQLVDEFLREGPKVDPVRQTIPPQTKDGRGRRRFRPHGHQYEHPLVERQLVDDRRGKLVEQVGVVDEQHDPLVRAPLGDCPADPPEQFGSSEVRTELRQDGGEGPQRQGRRGGDPGHPDRREPPFGRAALAFPGQMRLSHTRGPGQDHATGTGRQPADDLVPLGPKPDKGPFPGVSFHRRHQCRRTSPATPVPGSAQQVHPEHADSARPGSMPRTRAVMAWGRPGVP